jgi:membrane protein DedA with SNARE-associated domain
VPDLAELWPQFIDYFWPVFVNFALLILAGIGFPVPEEIPTVALGIWVGSADPNDKWRALRWFALPVAYLGVILADVLLYWIGRLWGRRLLQHRWLARLAPPDKRQKIEKNFQKYGVNILLMVRWVPAIRSPMFITAGITKLSFPKFLIADAIAAIAGHTLLFFLAWWFGLWFQDLINSFEHLKQVLVPLIVILAIVGVGVYFVVHFMRRPFSVGDPTEFPLIGDRVAARWEPKEAPAGNQPPQGKAANPAADGTNPQTDSPRKADNQNK